MSAFSSFIPSAINLSAQSRADFERMRALMDTCTNELLISPDWESNMALADAIQNTLDPEVIREAVLYLRKRLLNRSAYTVSMALTLAETLVKNCSHPLHAAVNDERFMKTMEKVARTYDEKTKRESRRETLEVLEKVLDIVQAWGEAFLPYRDTYPNIPEAYFNLRKEGFPFKAQFDQSRVPLFTPEHSSPRDQSGLGGLGLPARNSNTNNLDSNMARVLAESLAVRAGVAAQQSQVAQVKSSSTSTSEETQLLAQVTSATEMLGDILEAAEDARDIQSNDWAVDVAHECESLTKRLTSFIEEAINFNPDGLEELFRAHEQLQDTLDRYNMARSGRLVKRAVRQAANSQTQSLDTDLLGLSSEPVPQPSPISTAPATTASDPDPLTALLSSRSASSKAFAFPSPPESQSPWVTPATPNASLPVDPFTSIPAKITPTPTPTYVRVAVDPFTSTAAPTFLQAPANGAGSTAAADPFDALSLIATRHASTQPQTSTPTHSTSANYAMGLFPQTPTQTFPPGQTYGPSVQTPMQTVSSTNIPTASNPFDMLLNPDPTGYPSNHYPTPNASFPPGYSYPNPYQHPNYPVSYPTNPNASLYPNARPDGTYGRQP